MRIDGRVLHPGRCEGRILRLDAPLSFWGGVDPATGQVIDRAHPQLGAALAGRVVAMPGSRGSAGTPGVLAELLRSGVGPRVLLITKPDVNLVAGVLGAEALYGVTCPVVLITTETFALLEDGAEISQDF